MFFFNLFSQHIEAETLSGESIKFKGYYLEDLPYQIENTIISNGYTMDNIINIKISIMKVIEI